MPRYDYFFLILSLAYSQLFTLTLFQNAIVRFAIETGQRCLQLLLARGLKRTIRL